MFEPEFDPVTINVFDQPWKPVVLKTFFSLFEAAQISGKKCMVYIKLTIIQGKNLKLKGEKLKTQAKNSRFRQNQKRGLPKIGRKKKAAIT